LGVLATGATAAQAGNLVIKFTPATEVAIDDFLWIKPSVELYASDATVTCTAKTDGNAAAVDAATAVSGTGTAQLIKVKMDAKLLATKEAEITCTDAGTSKLKVLPAAATAVTFLVKTDKDTDGYTTARTGFTVNDGKATWGSAARTSVVGGTTSANAGDLTIKFTPKNALAPNGVITLKAYKNGVLSALVFGSDANKACTVKVGAGGDLASSTATDIKVATNVLSVKLGADVTDKLVAGTEAVIVCAKAGLEAIPAHSGTAADNVYTFSIKTTSDIVENTALTGYTVAGTSVTWGSATRSSLVGGVNGTLTFKFTPTVALANGDTITLTSSSAIFAYAATPVACAVTAVADLGGTAKPTFVAATTKSDATKKILTLTLAATGTDVVAATKEATVLCSSNLAAAAGHTHVYFDIKTSKDVEALTNQTGYTRAAAPTPTPTAAATPAATTANSTSTVAAASTTSVNMITIVALAAVALRQ